MTALTKGQRIAIAREPGPFQQQVTGIILTHATYLLLTPAGQHVVPPTEADLMIARDIVQTPELLTYSFASAALLRPQFDAVEEVSQITDAQLEPVIQELWQVMAARAAELIRPPDVFAVVETVAHLREHDDAPVLSDEGVYPVLGGRTLAPGDRVLVWHTAVGSFVGDVVPE